MSWNSIKGVFPPHSQRSRDRLQIHPHPDQDKALTEEMNDQVLKSLNSVISSFETDKTLFNRYDIETAIVAIEFVLESVVVMKWFCVSFAWPLVSSCSEADV